MSIERLDPQKASDAEQVADLHFQYLNDSPIVRFGPSFLRRFFYRALVRDGLVGVSFYRHDGQIVGFISYTTEPFGFMGKGGRKRPFALIWSLLVGIVQRPATAKDIAKVLRVMRERADEGAVTGDEGAVTGDEGEVISLVVDSAYRGHVPEDGKARVAVRLFEDAIEFFKDHKVGRVHLLVRPENLASNIFCSSMGAAFGKIEYGGETVHRYTYEIPKAAQAVEASS